MKDAWVAHALRMAAAPADFYSGCRKINTGVMLEFPGPIDQSLQIEDCGFTNMKLTLLRKLYWNDEHADKVAELWRGRVDRGKYGSVSASTYHHLTKSDPAKRSKRASVMGPCLLGVSLTLLNDRSVAVDAFYRTTELFKKYPADLVFIRDTALPALGVDPADVSRLRCHFANTTAHVMYFVTLVPHLSDPLAEFDKLRVDPRFYKWCIRWTSRFLLDEHAHGIAKFAQALRVQKDARERIDPKVIKKLQKYLRDNHPGYDRDKKKEAVDDDDDDGEE